MNFVVYVLQDENGSLYKCFTNNLERRINEHRRGYTKTTRRMKNIVLVYSEECSSLEEARKRELYLKSAAGRRFLKKKLS